MTTPDEVRLYSQAALEAALNLWPRDCRVCANYSAATDACVSALPCVDSDQFQSTAPRQCWTVLV